MKFGICIPNCHGDYTDPRLAAEVAYEAEQAGWDGFFTWDHIGDTWADEVSDPWIMLAAIAMRTRRITLGPLVTPLPRRRPWKVAREIVTLDHLSGGRVILGVGTGEGSEFPNYFEQTDHRSRGEMLDEALDILMRLWSGKRFSFDGRYYRLKDVRHLPRPLQQPHIPIWVAAQYPYQRPLRRAAHWDGLSIIANNAGLCDQLPAEQVRECVHRVYAERETQQRNGPYEVLHWGHFKGKDRGKHIEQAMAYADAGATWWIEDLNWTSGSLQEVRTTVCQGPPRL